MRTLVAVTALGLFAFLTALAMAVLVLAFPTAFAALHRSWSELIEWPERYFFVLLVGAGTYLATLGIKHAWDAWRCAEDWKDRLEQVPFETTDASRGTRKKNALEPLWEILENLAAQAAGTGWGQKLRQHWQMAWQTQWSWPYFPAIILAISAGYLAGFLITGGVPISSLLAILAAAGFILWIRARAQAERNRFHNQFPDVLDALSRSLKAGQSLHQAIVFVGDQLANPAGHEFKIVSEELQVGRSIEQVLRRLEGRWPSDDVHLAVEGITLQHRVGGNLAQMMEEVAGLIRQRVKVENDIKTLTAQGRLSAIIVGGMVPFSLFMLLAFAPRYSSILVTTDEGHALLFVAIVLAVFGFGWILRLSQIRY